MTEQPSEPVEQNPHANTAEGQGSITPLNWKPTPTYPVPVVRCTQIKKDGERCKRWSLRGYTKCHRHAGPGAMKDGNVAKYAEAVVEAARLRLIDSSEMALNVLEELTQPGTSEGIRLKAATEVLDRAGVRGGFDLKVDVQVTDNPADKIAERLEKLAAGAKHVEEMKAKARGQVTDDTDDEDDIIDVEIVPNTDDEQDTLF